jgi:hypothetical protein
MVTEFVNNHTLMKQQCQLQTLVKCLNCLLACIGDNSIRNRVMNIKAKRLLPASCKIFLGLFSPAINMHLFKKKMVMTLGQLLTPTDYVQNKPEFSNILH